MSSTICEKCTKRSKLNDLIVICIDCFKKEKGKPIQIIEEITKLIEKHDNHDCLVCGKYFDECGCYYDLGSAYIEEIQRIIERG